MCFPIDSPGQLYHLCAGARIAVRAQVDHKWRWSSPPCTVPAASLAGPAVPLPGYRRTTLVWYAHRRSRDMLRSRAARGHPECGSHRQMGAWRARSTTQSNRAGVCCTLRVRAPAAAGLSELARGFSRRAGCPIPRAACIHISRPAFGVARCVRPPPWAAVRRNAAASASTAGVHNRAAHPVLEPCLPSPRIPAILSVVEPDYCGENGADEALSHNSWPPASVR